ncbi:VCBS repeat-containing protein [Eikenella sp. S3360]|uniref:VCBS repeat-containing protein n=1 Tax=Eikenella glucosivorans TaxID=2766967 RepID=A0ABS0NCI5_9NEIS|nr:VCBS repeat-containing protein [Eikenella glucosivorans]MBH5330030.1 VCBS repeat-containing protein [Eikenella glucosivorans]
MKPALLILLAALPLAAHARSLTVSAPKLPPGWQAEVSSNGCNRDGMICLSPAQITLRHGNFSQTFQSEQLGFTDTGLRPDDIRMGDYNFDGKLDLAIRNGNNGHYSSPSYDIYVQTQSGRFVKSRELTELASDYLGMFQVDAARRTLTTAARDGCCFRVEETWQIIPGRSPQKIAVTTWDSRQANGAYTEITTKRLVNGRWRESVRRER